jgi:HAD superfamily hydrolase (TIGR01457 family)
MALPRSLLMNFINSPDALTRLKAVRCFVLDMDGTFYLGQELLPGAMEFFNAARATGHKILFLTNNSSHDGEYYVEKLHNMGCDVLDSEVYTSGMATCQYLNRVMKGKKAFLLGNKYLRSEFHKFGVPVSQGNPDIVVIGYDTTINYEKLCRVCALVRSGIPYIATHPDFNCPTEDGFVPDIGAVIAYIQASTGRVPDYVVGKPNEGIVEGMLELTGMGPGELCICGDRLYTDIATGVNHGLLSVCVLTGEATQASISESTVKPDLVFDRLGDLVNYL